MKRLITFRHAKSGWDQPTMRDFDRGLNAKGRRAAATMGRHMRTLGLVFDAVLASPAVRVAETLDAMADGYGRRITPAWDRRLYLATAQTLLEAIQEADDGVETLMIAAHNPGIEELVLLLAGAGGEEELATRGSVEDKYPTAAIAELHFEADRWSAVAPGGGQLIRFVRPRDLDPTLGPERG
ncbi:SixA phosphatase family protein [Sphingomonas morindae]|uniref:Histidine phosphatase family protein n=1 Tax=Sphingomonas morindae TaxID=1541170 RepID=A0ABY4XB23_9SPHN|nr:histidine phosphatase family protein [Sphingomonas morindae]USI74157.1 histidine phosphatase family protein [Sphingomonas morindae]